MRRPRHPRGHDLTQRGGDGRPGGPGEAPPGTANQTTAGRKAPGSGAGAGRARSAERCPRGCPRATRGGWGGVGVPRVPGGRRPGRHRLQWLALVFLVLVVSQWLGMIRWAGAVRYVETYATQEQVRLGQRSLAIRPRQGRLGRRGDGTGLHDCPQPPRCTMRICWGRPDHPTHGKDYRECRDVRVNGGLTFADGCAESGDPSRFVCHIPQPGRPDKVWWFGLDSAHAYDELLEWRASDRKRYEEAKANRDPEECGFRGIRRIRTSRYCSLPYVESQVKRLAGQLIRHLKGIEVRANA